jgi:hypothetical protein
MVEGLRAKSGTERMQIAFGIFRAARRMIERSLRSEHPEWDDEELRRAVAGCIAEYPDDRKWPVWVTGGGALAEREAGQAPGLFTR